MIKLKITVSGLFASIRKMPDLNGFIAVQTRQCLHDAMTEWVTRTQSPGFRDRFGPGAYSKRGLTHRKASYEKRQARVLEGGIQPYAKPRSLNFLRLAKATMSGDARQILRAAQDLARTQNPMRRAIFVEGSGFRVSASGSRTIRSSITLPAARILNRGGSKGQKYRDELLDMSLSGGVDKIWIFGRVKELMQERVWRPLTSASRVALAG